VGVPRALWAVVAAACCDTVMIVLGAAGVATLLTTFPQVRAALLLAGAGFLTYLGVQALRRAGRRLDPGADPGAGSVRQIVSRTASVSLLNPHAILDTVGVIGGAVLLQPSEARLVFAAGAISASWIWFTFLAVAAAALRHRLTGTAMVWFDRLSGVIMLAFAGLFLVELVHGITA
jgi:L-lysine exporter family protein LysE/ArgO